VDLAVPFPEFMAAVDAEADRLGLPNSDAMVVPSEAERDAFAVAVTKALAGQCSLLPAPYKVARWQGPPGPQGAKGETLRVVAEMGNDGRPTPQRFWGTYALREPASAGPDGGTRLLAIEAPHPLYDVHTSEEAAHLFGATRARYFLEAGGDRCISRVQSACSGTSDVCGPKGPYRVSDAAHAVIHPFFAVHRLLSETEPLLHFVQLHGNSEPSCPDVLLSDASGDWDEQGATAALARALAQRSVAVGRCGKDYPKGPCDLCGGGNVEARVTAQSTDACRRGGRTYGRFLHLEQSRAFRATPSPTQAGYGPLIDAVNDAFPETR
jgi:hypothetical protein